MSTSWRAAIPFAVAGLLLFSAPAVAQPGVPPSTYVAGELLVASKGGVAHDELRQLYARHGGRLKKVIGQINVHHISAPDSALDAVEAALRRNPKVKFVDRNFIGSAQRVPNDPGYAYQWHLPKVSAPGGWDLSVGSASVPIAVVDSGVDLAHPDLAQKLLPGFNFVSDTTDTRDGHGHGTAVAGIAAATTNEGFGVAGLAWTNPIMPLVVLDSNASGTVADVAAAIIWAADHGARVINLSLGFTGYTSTLQNAVNYAWSRGLVIVAAGGNQASLSPLYPAGFDNVVAVGATDQSDQLTSFSNYGTWLDVVAPGVSVYTTRKGGSYWYTQGTSVSTPQVAALAALLLSVNPALSNAQVKELIKTSADDLGSPGFDLSYGWGRINVARTLEAAAQAIPADTVPPSVMITFPTSGKTVSGTVTVQVSATDGGRVARVELYADGKLTGTDVTAPFAFVWNTTGLTGSHTLSAKAYDAAGNSATSAVVSVTVGAADNTPPAVAITGVVYDGKFLTVLISATDASRVRRVELYVDGALKATDTAAPWTFRINATRWARGLHTLQARGFDAENNISVSSPVTFTKY